MAPRIRRSLRQGRPISAFFLPQTFPVITTHSYYQLTGSVVRVRYTVPTERNERESDFLNHPDYIRAL